MTKKIKDFMSTKHACFSVPLETPVEDAVKEFIKQGLNHILVRNDKGDIVGIFTEKDLAKKVIAADKDIKTTKISEVMTKDPISVDWNTDVDSCMFIMFKNNFRHLIVRNNQGSMCAVASARDILKAKVQAVKEIEESENLFEATETVDYDEDTIDKSIKEYQA